MILTPDNRIVLPRRWMTRRRALLSLIPIIGQIRRRGYLQSWDFSETGAPTGWTFNGTGVCNYDWGGGSPQGGHALLVESNTNSDLGGAQKTLAIPSAKYGIYFQFRQNNVGGSNRNVWITPSSWFGFYGSAPTQRYRDNGISGFTLTEFTWYHVWIENEPGVAHRLYLSTSGTKPGSATMSLSALVSAPSRMSISAPMGNGIGVDKLRVSSSFFGSNPT